MDVLAEASLVASNKDDDAAHILSLLRGDARSASPFCADDTEPPLGSPTSEETEPLCLPPQPWSRSEDDLLRRLAAARSLPPTCRSIDGMLSGLDEEEMQAWCDIASHFDGRTPAQCASRYQKVLNPDNVKGEPPSPPPPPPPHGLSPPRSARGAAPAPPSPARSRRSRRWQVRGPSRRTTS